MRENELPNFDVSRFHFYCPEDRAYVVFDPASQEESDRLDALLGATPICRRIVAERTPKEETATIQLVSEVQHVGYVGDTAEAIVLAITAAVAGNGKASGQWQAVRVNEGGYKELIADMEKGLETRKAELSETLKGDL
jgi:hypothetical protein